MLPDILLASKNYYKIEELRQLLSPFGFNLKTAHDFEGTLDVIEDQPDLQGNALKKAEQWFKRTGLPSLADDTGLEVDALNGGPGVYSARYAGEGATDADNIVRLLDELSTAPTRTARFRTVLAFVTVEETYLFEGVCHGRIVKQPKGEKGFGYDPVFQPDGYDKTFAELSPEVKNRISHRGRALQKFIQFLENRDQP